MLDSQLPVDSDNQPFVSVKAILAGHLFLPYLEVFQDSIHLPVTSGSRVPDFCFLINHPAHGQALFDLGLRKHAKGYPPAMKGTLHDFKAECDEDVVDMLHKDGIEPEQINQVIYSHLHFDHVGDPTPFTAAEIVLGADAQTLLADSYPTNQDSYIQALPANRKVTYLDFSVSASHKYKIVSPIGTFDRAIDFYDDGSLYFVDSPGHSPGHIAALARVAPNNFVFLAGDTCHNRECYVPGTRLISEENYADLEMARETVTRLVRMNKEVHNVVTILAHEAEREQDMPQFPVDLKEWAVEEIQKRKAKTGGVEA